MGRVLVIGIDGATWELIDPWMSMGRLPSLKNLVKNGVRATLESTVPPLTGPAWVSFATGKNPGKHGCYDFLLPDGSLNNRKPISTKDISSKVFYEILDENGKKCIIINLPCSYPPRIEGIVISSILTASENCIFPPTLIEEIPELENYKITPGMSVLLKGEVAQGINKYREVERIRFECAKKLFGREWDLFFILFKMSDWIQHQMYHELISGEAAEDTEAVQALEDIDRYIGWFLDNVSPDTSILVMSDHGFGEYERKFAINKWLMEEGYLKVKPPNRRRIAIPFSKPIMDFIAGYERLVGVLHRVVGKRLPQMTALEKAVISIEADLSQTVAYSVATKSGPCGSIHINLKSRFKNGKVEAGADYEKLRRDLIAKLKMLRDPKTGRKIFKSVLSKEDAYWGASLGKAPDVIVVSDEHDISVKNIPVFLDGWVECDHSLEGIFIAYGPDIKQSTEIRAAKIYDIAPTILHMFKIRIPSDMDGEVLREIFKQNTDLANSSDKMH